jgi:hypothetical protein
VTEVAFSNAVKGLQVKNVCASIIGSCGQECLVRVFFLAGELKLVCEGIFPHRLIKELALAPNKPKFYVRTTPPAFGKFGFFLAGCMLCLTCILIGVMQTMSREQEEARLARHLSKVQLHPGEKQLHPEGRLLGRMLRQIPPAPPQASVKTAPAKMEVFVEGATRSWRRQTARFVTNVTTVTSQCMDLAYGVGSTSTRRTTSSSAMESAIKMPKQVQVPRQALTHHPKREGRRDCKYRLAFRVHFHDL